nr:ribosomal protein L4 [uncultured bacterium]
MNAIIYNQQGEKKGEYSLSESLFGVVPHEGLMHMALIRQLAHARAGTAFAKTRAMVRGGGRKPFKQKGTGRARQGTIRAPQMRGGGAVFGPTGRENFETRMPKKMRRLALLSALSSKSSKVSVLDVFASERPSTKMVAAFLQTVSAPRKVLVVADQKDLVLEKSLANIPGVLFVTASYLNVVDVLNADMLLFLEAGMKKAEEVFCS